MDSVQRPDIYASAWQRALASWNRRRLAPTDPDSEQSDDSNMLDAEALLLETLRVEVGPVVGRCPTDAEGFVTWFEHLAETGFGQRHQLFPWIAQRASLDEVRWFLEQEAAGEAGFDDLVALTQVRMPVRAKLELARNYWDEMGRGNASGMHGPMLDRLARALGVEPQIETTVPESLMLANTMTAMATRREYAWHSIGALGVIELTAPGRAKLVSQGLRRLGVSGKERHYFDLHAVLDVKHSAAWNEEIILPIVAQDPSRARFIAEGALMRLSCGERCFDRYAEILGVSVSAGSMHNPAQLSLLSFS